jgi:hypothetical protein
MKYKNEDYFTISTFALLIIGILVGSAVGVYYIIRYTQTHYTTCEILNNTHNDCRTETQYALLGKPYTVYFIDQYYDLDHNRSGILFCNSAWGCQDLCQYPANKNYTCSKYGTNLYQLGVSPDGLYVVAGFVLAIGIIFASIITCSVMFVYYMVEETRKELQIEEQKRMELQSVNVINSDSAVSLQDSNATPNVSLQDSSATPNVSLREN